MALVVLAGLGEFIYMENLRVQKDREATAAARRAALFDEIKAGDDGAGIGINDPKLVVMLADDPMCVANLTYLNLDMADLDAPEFASTSRLTSVKRIYIYSCHQLDEFIANLAEMPNVEELEIEAGIPSEATIRRLTIVFANLKKLRCGWVVDKSSERLIRETFPSIDVDMPYTEAQEAR